MHNFKEISFISRSDNMEDGNEIYQQPTLSDMIVKDDVVEL